MATRLARRLSSRSGIMYPLGWKYRALCNHCASLRRLGKTSGFNDSRARREWQPARYTAGTPLLLPAPLKAMPQPMAKISSLIFPEGMLTSVISLIRFPSRALPMGETLEIFPCDGSASALPVMVY